MKTKKKTVKKKGAKLDLDDKPSFAKNFDKLMAKHIKKAIKQNASGSAI